MLTTLGRRGQTGVVSYLFVLFVFSLVWIFFLSGFLSYWGAEAVASQGLTGIEAFLISNINLVIFLCVVIASAAGIAVMGGGVN